MPEAKSTPQRIRVSGQTMCLLLGGKDVVARRLSANLYSDPRDRVSYFDSDVELHCTVEELENIVSR